MQTVCILTNFDLVVLSSMEQGYIGIQSTNINNYQFVLHKSTQYVSSSLMKLNESIIKVYLG